MNKEQALDTIKLLCALESWTFSLKQTLPDYLHDQLQAAVAILETTVLSKDTGTTQRQLKPLTDEEIEEIAGRTMFPIKFARAIEDAHGIKGGA